ATPTFTRTYTPTPTPSPTRTPTPTDTPSPTNTLTPTIDTTATSLAATDAAYQTATALAKPAYSDLGSLIVDLDKAVGPYFDCKTYIGIYQFLDETRASNNTVFDRYWPLLDEPYSQNLNQFCDTDARRDRTRELIDDPDLYQDMQDLSSFIDL